MNPNEETPATDDAIVAQLRAAEADLGHPAEEPCEDCGEAHGAVPGLDQLMDFLTKKFGEMEQEAADHAAHQERMKGISQAMRDSMVAADQTLADEFEGDRLSWGIWKTKCGCIHLGLPNGKGGWATRPEELEEVATSELMEEVVRAIAATGAVVLELAQELAQEGR